MATQRQKKAIALLAENGGNVSKAMRDAGYTKVSAATPKKLTESKAFQTYADSIPDDLLHEKHIALLNKVDKEGYLDAVAVKAGLDMAYKIKGTYAPEKKKLEGTLEINDTSKLDKLIEQIENELDAEGTTESA